MSEARATRRFVLRDASGVSRATLGVADDGTPLHVFTDLLRRGDTR